MSGVGGLARGLTSIARVNQAIARLASVETQIDCARDVAAHLDTVIKSDFDGARTVYETARPLGVDGNRVSLISGRIWHKYASQAGSHHSKTGVRSGRASPGSGKGRGSGASVSMRRSLGFVAVGTIVRASLPQKYAKFMVGRFKLLPVKLPAVWTPGIQAVINKRLHARMAAAGATRVAA